MTHERISQATQSKSIYQLKAEMCAALASPIRLQILDLLSDGEKSSAELLEVLNIPKANLSQHLAVLKGAGIVHSRREGTYQYVSVALPQIKEACGIVQAILLDKIAKDEDLNAELIKELRARRSL